MDNTENISHERQVKLTDANVGKQEPIPTSPGNFKFQTSALSWGIAAGLLMAVYLLFLQLSIGDGSIAMKFFKYLFLFASLGWVLWRYRGLNQSSSFFQKGIGLGALTTLYAGLALVAVGLVIAVAAPELAFEKFTLVIDSPGDLVMTSVAIFFEVLVFGMVGTFIWLQYLKNKPFETADHR